MFCPKCGSMLIPRKEDGKRTLYCSCGFKNKDLSDAKLKESIVDKSKKIEVIEKDVQTLPLIDEQCPKCGHGRAYYWLAQTRGADESETRFFKCQKCGNSWRDAS